ECADAVTLSDREVTDALFGRLRCFYEDDALVELTAVIAWENASSTFNRALRIPSQGCGSAPEGGRPSRPRGEPHGHRHPDLRPHHRAGRDRTLRGALAPARGPRALRGADRRP